jgi:hypothetical protein
MIFIVLSLFIYSYSKTIAWKESVCIYTDMRAYSYKHTAKGGDISTKYEVVVNYSYDFENKIYSGSFSNQGYILYVALYETSLLNYLPARFYNVLKKSQLMP